MTTATEHNEPLTASAKLVIAWAGTVLGSVTLNDLVLFATLVFTLLNIVKVLRELWTNRKEKK